MNNFNAIEHDKYLTSDCLSGGDYGGLGYIAHVNVIGLTEAAEESDAKESIAHCGMNSWALRDCVDEHNSVGFPPALIISEGGYNSITAYIHPDWVEGVEILEALSDYPVIDDEKLSAREMELEQESWENCIAHDLEMAVLEHVLDDEIAERVEAFIEANPITLQHRFHAVCEELNTYAEFEGDGGCYYRGLTDEIAPKVAEWMTGEVDTSPLAGAIRAVRDGLIPPLNFDREMH